MCTFTKNIESSPRIITLAEILAAIEPAFGVPADLIRSPERRAIASIPRHAFCLASRQYTKSTFEQIAQFLNRHHSTVLASVHTAECLLSQDFEDFPQCYRLFKRILNVD